MTAYVAPGIMRPEEIVAEVWNIELERLHCKRKTRDVAEPRQVIMWYYQTFKRYSQARAGMMFDRDSNTALWAKNTVNGLIKNDREFRSKITELLKKCNEQVTTN